ncbi:MAG TPA: acylphosphatase [Methanothrix sp.]|nr:acylphosphatase [Methanothrix sp.]
MKLNLKISGTAVHDVGYRAFLLEAGEDLGLSGFQARNLVEDGRQAVAVLLEGEQDCLAEFQRIARAQKPEKAMVSEVSFSDYAGPVEAIGSFAGKFQARQLRKGISSIIRMESKQDQMIDLQRMMLDKQDQMLNKQDQMLSLQSRTIDELRETKVEIIGELRETKTEIVEKLDETKVEIIGELRETKKEIVGEVCKTRETIVEKLDENQKATVKAVRESSEAVIEELRDSRENTAEDIRDLRVDLRSSLDKKISRMEKDISQIKARSGA